MGGDPVLGGVDVVPEFGCVIVRRVRGQVKDHGGLGIRLRSDPLDRPARPVRRVDV